VQIEFWCYHQGEERISIIKSWSQEGQPGNENKQNCHITRCRLTSGNRPTLPKCGMEGVVLFYCVLVTLNVKMVMFLLLNIDDNQ